MWRNTQWDFLEDVAMDKCQDIQKTIDASACCISIDQHMMLTDHFQAAHVMEYPMGLLRDGAEEGMPGNLNMSGVSLLYICRSK